MKTHHFLKFAAVFLAVGSLLALRGAAQVVAGNGAFFAGQVTPGGGGGGGSFADLTSGTNSTAAMVVDTGASLGASGSGTITFTDGPIDGITGFGAGVNAALKVDIPNAGSIVQVNGALGAATATSINGNTLTTGTWTLNGVAGKTLLFDKTLEFDGTDSTKHTFPSTSSTVARIDAGQTFVGVNTFGGAFIRTPATITISANAGTVTVTNAYSQTQTLAGATALTMSANGTAGQYVTVDCVTDSTLRVVTFKNADASIIQAISCPPSLTTTILLRSTGTVWVVVGGSPNLLDASADTTPAATKLIATVSAATGVTAKSTLPQIITQANSGDLTTASNPQFATIELGAASDTTVSRSGAGVMAVEGVVIPSISSANTLTNKRITARVGSTTSSATPSINTDTYDIYKLTAQAADITSMTTNLSGTPVDGDQFQLIVTGTAARAITWGTGFVAGPTALPTTTTTTKTLYVYFQYDSVVTHWVCMFSGSLP